MWASIICVDKLGKISTTGLNAHLRAKHGNQLDVGASELIRDIEKFENPTPRQQITSMLKKRHFSLTGIIVTPRRAKLYPDHVEQKYMIAKCIEFFGFMAYPDLPREECMPNLLLRPRDPNYTFAQFGDAAFQKTRLVPIPEGTPIEVENPNQTDAQQSTASDESLTVQLKLYNSKAHFPLCHCIIGKHIFIFLMRGLVPGGRFNVWR